MQETAGPPSYEELLDRFKAVLNHALLEGHLSPACLTFDLVVVQAVGDVVRAVRDGSLTNELVNEACRAFAKYAADQDAAQRPTSSRRHGLSNTISRPSRAGTAIEQSLSRVDMRPATRP
ncbi:hypothetical protein AWC06_08055 [Mycobacterium fragae]|uniref:Uncharacterized protein n=1 Tax=Mycobacterium fragae TaxID=1260918 RepID=A0A1X1V4D8_9MYCO|nr:hypothetical protein AWC06_08055 [Mycobacterium fragae]